MSIRADVIELLRDPTLIRDASYLGGEWVAASERSTFPVINPATGEAIAHIPELSICDWRKAIDAAHAAQKLWAALTARERATRLRRLFDLVIANTDDLATILTVEQGKPLAEARGEVLYGANYVEWYAEEAKRQYGDVIPGHQPDKRIIVTRQPVGVVGAITAWNFPVAMPLRKIAPALAAGCTIVFKPAAQTPLSAIAIAVLAERAQIPAGTLSVITTQDAVGFGQEICRNDRVRKLTFTGSTAVGRQLMRQASDRIVKLSLELGGNAPFVVFDDADVDAAVEGAILSKFRNAGQTCVCANRIYVQSGVYEEFAYKLTERVSTLTVGNGLAPETQIGPLVDNNAVLKVESHIADAVSKGAIVSTGGSRLNHGLNFFAPTVLTNVTQSMRVAKEETFGPLAPIFSFDSVEQVVEMANDTEFGLASYFYARDLQKVWLVAEALEYGMVGVNTGVISTEIAPFGGIKQSGIGREGSKYGLEDFTELKYICMGGI